MSNPLITEDLPFLDLFVPPEGYALDFLEMTTFSLSLSLLATLPFLLYQGEHGGIKNGEVTGNPQRLMKRRVDYNNPSSPYIYEDYSKKFRLLYDGKTKSHADSIQASPSTLRVANYLLEHSCKEVHVPNGLFHPKIMLFQFKEKEPIKEKEPKDTSKPVFFYRLMIGSRNFTMSNYLETGICLEGYSNQNTGSKTLKTINERLCNFFGKYWNYSSLYSNNYPPCIHWVNFLNTPLKATQKGVTATGISFGKMSLTPSAPQKINPTNGGNNPAIGERKMIDPTTIGSLKLNGISTQAKIIDQTKKPNLADVIGNDAQKAPMLIVSMNPSPNPFSHPKRQNHFVRNPLDNDIPKNGTKPANTTPTNHWVLMTAQSTHRYLHSKMFLYEQNKNLVLWIGSANCTTKGLNGTNEEVMVRCVSTPKLPEGTNDFFDSLLKPSPKTPNNHFTQDTTYTKNVLSVEEMDNEETVCPVTVESEWDSTNSQWKLTLSNIHCDWNVFPLVGGKMVQVTVPTSSSNDKIYFPMRKENFTNIFIIQSLDQKQTYRHVADMSKVCGGVKPVLATLLGDIPLEPLEELRDLVQKYKGEADNVHALERLMLHYKACSATGFSEICEEVLDNMAIYEEVYQKVTNCCVASSLDKDKRDTIDKYTDFNLSDEKKYENKAVARSVERYKADFKELKELVQKLEELVKS